MSSYQAPTADMRYVLDVVANMKAIAASEKFSDASDDVVDAVLEEAGKLAAEVMAPLNKIGDEQGCKLENGVVRMPEGFGSAYKQYVMGGWNGLGAPKEIGGQGLPWCLATAVQESWASSNLALSLCPMLNQGSILAIERHGSEALQSQYLPKMVSGEWTGTMCLTEPQAGSDVGALRTKAELQEDGSYLISGQKIFITFGEHDMSENIIHLVLARTPDAPAGVKGISMFVVPKFLLAEDGSPGPRNDLRCVSVEKKLGIHASPTCSMSFGDNGECVGYLLGRESEGMQNMFTMMNHARIAVGLQGVAVGERAYQQAVAFARERVQGKPFGAEGEGPHGIIEHADVRRMLMTMRAKTESCRALAYLTASAVDRAQSSTSEEDRKKWKGLADILTPVTKAHCSDTGLEVASMGVQVHGGMGFIEETGAAQHMRDARIAHIYEGTNGIQAIDLVGRKLQMEGGQYWRSFIRQMAEFALGISQKGPFAPARDALERSLIVLSEASETLFKSFPKSPRSAEAGAASYLRLFGLVTGGYLMARQGLEAETRLKNGDDNQAFLKAKSATARFYCLHILPEAEGLYTPTVSGDETLFEIAAEDL